MSNNKRKNNSIYNNYSEYNSNGNENDEDEVGKEEQQIKDKRHKRISKEQSNQLWPLYSQLRPSYENEKETSTAISKTDDYSMFSPHQIKKKIANIKNIHKIKRIPPTTTIIATITTTTKNDDKDDYIDTDKDDTSDIDNDDDDNELDTASKSQFHYFKIWSEESNEELLKLYKESRHLYSTDRDFVRKIMQDKSFTRDEYSFEQILRQLYSFRNKLNIKITNAPRQPPPIPPDRLELWELFKSLRPNYTTDKDTIIKLMNDNEKYNSQYSFSLITGIISNLKSRLDTPPPKVLNNATNDINRIRVRSRGNINGDNGNSLAVVSRSPLIQQDEEYQDKEKQNDNSLALVIAEPPFIEQEGEEVLIKEIKDKLQKYKNENKELKSKVGTLNNRVLNLNNIIKENKESQISVNSNYLNSNTEVVSSNSAIIIKSTSSNDDIYFISNIFRW